MPRSLPRVVASLFALAALLHPSLASACPVCGQGAPGTEGAILLMSGILSALPLLMAGGIIAWVVIRARAAAARDSSVRPADGGGNPGAAAGAEDRPPVSRDASVTTTMKTARTIAPSPSEVR